MEEISAIAHRLGLDGYQVVVFATRPKEVSMEHLKVLDEAGISWHYVQGTLDRGEDRKRLIQETVEKYGRIDVLVNNAGVAPLVRADLLEMTEESYDRVMGINAKGTTTLFADRLAGDSILVHEVRPGVIRTDMTSTVQEKYDELIEKGVFPISRWGLPEDVANAVSAFCSDQFLYTTGNYVDVDGGFHIKRL